MYRKVRLACAEGMSQRQAARHFNISRDSVRKTLALPVPPGDLRTAPVKRPKLDGFTEIIDGWLEDGRGSRPRQRHTAKRVFDRLREELIPTCYGREFRGTERHPYELYLDLDGIEHRRTKVTSPGTNGFVERFNGTVLDEFFRVTMRETCCETVAALQADLDAWLVHYNTKRPHPGYRNQGRRPIETVMSFVRQEG